jgi:hypothetical protein
MIDIKAEFKKDLRQDLDKFGDGLKKGLDKNSLIAAEYLRSVISKTIHGMRLVFTGNLARSYIPKVLRGKGGAYRSGVFSDSIYAEIQDTGGSSKGVIKPKSVKFLAIPLQDTLRRSAKWPRHFSQGELFYFKSKSGKEFLAKNKGSGKRRNLELMYILKKQVKIYPKHYLKASLAKAEEGLAKLIGDVTDKAIGAVQK